MYRVKNQILVLSFALTALCPSQGAFSLQTVSGTGGEARQSVPETKAAVTQQEQVTALVRKLSDRDPEVRAHAAEAGSQPALRPIV